MNAVNFLRKEELKVLKDSNFNLCLQCGKCTASCPMFFRAGLNPRTLVRKTLYFLSPVKISPSLSISDVNKVWNCTTCGSCLIRCPRDVRPLDIIIKYRTISIERGNIPQRIKEALENIYNFGNPFGISNLRRAEWAKDLGIKKASSESSVNLLYFVGCVTSYDRRAQNIARSFATILKNSEVSFSVLAENEKCCGNEAYSIGEEGLFDVLKEDNVNYLQKLKINNIVTTCPHCFNALKNHYKLEKEGIVVQHYTEFLASLIDKNKISFSSRISKKIAFHDPCYLGKHNKIFEEPRKVLENIPGVTLIELDHSRNNSICCGCGGGRMWYEDPNEVLRPSEDRIKEAVEVGADILAVGCPFCLLELEDATKRMGCENTVQVLDVTEIVNESILQRL